MLAKSIFNNIESLVSRALIGMEKDEYEKMKENVRSISEKLEGKQENTRLNSVNLRKTNL